MQTINSPGRLSTTIMISIIFGSFIHDAQIHNVASIVNITSKRDAVGSHYASELLKIPSHATLSEVSVLTNSGGQQVSTQPRNENDKKYLSPRRTATNHTDSDYNLLINS